MSSRSMPADDYNGRAMNERLVRTASHWGAYWAKVRDGRVVGVAPFEHDEHPSPLAQSQVAAVYDASRIDRPHVRQGFLARGRDNNNGSDDVERDCARRGVDPFVAVDWDTALALAAGELARVKSSFGNASI